MTPLRLTGRRKVLHMVHTDIDAVLFDLDGVLTPTAEIHRQAWEEMFSGFLDSSGARPYTDRDYFRFLDGKPRGEGIASLLADRGIPLGEGRPEDGPETESIAGLGNRKNQMFLELLERGIAPYPGSLRYLDAVHAAGLAAAVVSSSRNAPRVLRAAGLADRFEVVVDGEVAAAEHLAGKPQPGTFLHGARLLGVDPGRALVVEDAVSGVEAGAAGGFRHVVGVDRGVGPESLRSAGADVVVRDLDELLDRDGRLCP